MFTSILMLGSLHMKYPAHMNVAFLLPATHLAQWPESASELCRPSDRCLSEKLVPTFADIGCHVVSVTDP
jgi:hypothetical protein